MALTKEECEEASIDIEQALCDLEELRTHVSVNCIYNGGLETLKQLINEHFDNPVFTSQTHRQLFSCYKKVIERCAMQSMTIEELNDQLSKYDEWEMRMVQERVNPPLKFEELKAGMWVWDNKYLAYRYLSSIIRNPILNFHEYQYEFYDRAKACVNVVSVTYSPNRFYRREVTTNA